MSKKKIQIECPSCGLTFLRVLLATLWIESIMMVTTLAAIVLSASKTTGPRILVGLPTSNRMTIADLLLGPAEGELMSHCKVIIIGNMGRDPELRYTQSGQPVCSFSLAWSEKKKDAQGNMNEITTWARCTFWGRQAELIAQHFVKGKPIYVEGKLRMDKYVKDGVERPSLEVNCNEFQFIGGNDGGGSGGGQGQQGAGRAPSPREQARQAAAPSRPASSRPAAMSIDDEAADDGPPF